ncbi:u3 small nucleolar ribonucleoprotein MPP10, partial [Lobosporangium transversale]
MPDEALLKSFHDQVLARPEVFLTKSETSAEQAKAITKYLYDLGKSTESGSLKKHGSMLEELFIDGFDNDQIWEEIHMQNTPFLSYLKLELKNLKSNKSGTPSSKAAASDDDEDENKGEEGKHGQDHDQAEDDDEAEMNLGLDDEDMGVDIADTDHMEGFSGEDDAENFDDMEPEDYQERGEDEDDDDDEEEEEEEEEDLDDLDLPVKKRTKTSEVDDDFFNLEEFNALTEKQEQDELEDKEPEDDDEEIDYFADPDVIESGDEDDDFGNMGENEDEADAHDVTYKDFFAPPPRGTTNRFKAQRPSKNNEDSFGKAENSDDLEMEDADEDDENAEINELGDRVSNLFGIDEAEDDEA